VISSTTTVPIGMTMITLSNIEASDTSARSSSKNPRVVGTAAATRSVVATIATAPNP
jgi:hypothetical protein